MYRTRFMILVLRCLLSLMRHNICLLGDANTMDDCEELIADLKKHGGE